MSGGSERELAELRSKLSRLHAENVKLSRLLDLRGFDTRPLPEQLAVPCEPGMVTMASPVTDKLALYRDRFQGRRDVYAVRWENRRAGTSGWMPSVAGGWRKGMHRGSARYLPLTPDVIAAHLAGEVFIGLYPLLNDNSCWFLVADFDGVTAMLDALAYAKAARAEAVPAAVEVSKSGRGVYVWVFFAAPVAASVARAMGTVFLREAMVLRGTMDLRSYDRLFPNQDVMPEGGFGNLIAAPLQRRYRDNGLTVFLDLASLEPHIDQWAFLSTLDWCGPTDADRVARRAKQATTGSDISRLWKSATTRIQPPLPPVVRAELGAALTMEIAELTPAALATFKHAASMTNPKFYELQRLRKSTWDTPRFVWAYDVTVDDHLVLPRGLRNTVAELVENAGSTLSVTDLRTAGTEIDVTFAGELDQSQSRAASAILAHDDGVLVAPPGSGKTVIACAVITERATSTLILVDRKALAEQWRTRIQTFLGFAAGQYGAGRKKLTGTIDIAMLPSLARHGDVEGLVAGYGQVIVDECHHLAAAAYDHSVKKIGAQFWLGLTATPVRRDGLGNLVTWQLGPLRHTLDQPSESTLIDLAEPRMVATRLLYLHETPFSWNDSDGLSSSPVAAAHGALAVDEARNEQVVADVVDALGRGRNCLVLTRRVAHLNDLATRLRAQERDPMILQGGMSTADRRDVVARLDDARAGDGLLVIGTTPYIGEGFDAPALDTLFLAAPISFEGLLVQCAGRVIRTALGKTTAEVHDYHDAAVPILASSLQRRMPGYRTLGFTRQP